MNTNGFGEAVAEGMDGLKDAVLVAIAQRHPDYFPAVGTREQPEGHLAHDSWIEDGNGAGCIEQANDAEGAVGEGTLKVGEEDTAAGALAWPGRGREFGRNGAQDGKVEFKDDTKVGLLGASLGDGAKAGHLDADEQGLPCAVVMALVAKSG